MFDSEFRIVFWLILGMGALVGIVVLLGTVLHIAIFGTVFGRILKGLRDSSAGRPAAPRCKHCGSALPNGIAQCPSCGAPSD